MPPFDPFAWQYRMKIESFDQQTHARHCTDMLMTCRHAPLVQGRRYLGRQRRMLRWQWWRRSEFRV